MDVGWMHEGWMPMRACRNWHIVPTYLRTAAEHLPIFRLWVVSASVDESGSYALSGPLALALPLVSLCLSSRLVSSCPLSHPPTPRPARRRQSADYASNSPRPHPFVPLLVPLAARSRPRRHRQAAGGRQRMGQPRTCYGVARANARPAPPALLPLCAPLFGPSVVLLSQPSQTSKASRRGASLPVARLRLLS
jgi:hypothetical protein